MNSVSSTAIPRRVFLQGSLLVGCGLVLAACSDTNTASGGKTNTGPVRIGIPSDVDFSGVMRFYAPNQPIRRTLFDNLIDKNADGSYRPALATKWEWNSDQTSLVFTLRSGVTYHTGRTFGPDDVIATINAALKAGSGVQVAAMLNKASGVSKTGASQVTVKFDKPFSGYLDAIAVLPIIDIETYANIASGKQVIGTGPFKLTSYTPGSSIKMERYDGYWQKAKPSVTGLNMQIITDASAMLAAMRSGDLDFAQRMLPRDAATLKKDAKFSVAHTEGFDVYVGVNTKVKPLDDVRVRQAIAYAIDRKRIADQVYSGFAEPSCIPWSSSVKGVTKQQVDKYTYDISKAKSLLAAAGAAGTTVSLTSFAADPAYQAIQDIVQYGLEQAGFTVNNVTNDSATFTKLLQTATMPGLWVTAVALTTLGPTTALLTALPLTAGKNTSNVDDPKYGKLIDGMMNASSDKDLATATGELTDYLLEQAFHNTAIQAQTPYVEVAGLKGVSTDLTLSSDFTNVKFSS
jgi:peptide/nickel transport system substrate-binding protein